MEEIRATIEKLTNELRKLEARSRVAPGDFPFMPLTDAVEYTKCTLPERRVEWRGLILVEEFKLLLCRPEKVTPEEFQTLWEKVRSQRRAMAGIASHFRRMHPDYDGHGWKDIDDDLPQYS